MRTFTALEYELLLDSGAAHATVGNEFHLCPDDISPAAVAMIEARFQAMPCGECSHDGAEPCTHGPFETKNLGAVAVQSSMHGMRGPVLFLEHLKLTALEELLLTEVHALRPVTAADQQIFAAEWSGAADALAQYRFTLDLTPLGTGRAFVFLFREVYKPGCLQDYPQLALAEVLAEKRRIIKHARLAKAPLVRKAARPRSVEQRRAA
jgi:hypothetical protein